jgi:hypothetical protein
MGAGEDSSQSFRENYFIRSRQFFDRPPSVIGHHFHLYGSPMISGNCVVGRSN